MRRAALQNVFAAALAFAGAAFLAPSAGATPAPSTRGSWAVEVNGSTSRFLGSKLLSELRAAGVKSIVMDATVLTANERICLTRRATNAGLVVVSLLGNGSSARAVSPCSLPTRRPRGRCAVLARSAADATSMAPTSLIAVRVSSPAALAKLAGGPRSPQVITLMRREAPGLFGKNWSQPLVLAMRSGVIVAIQIRSRASLRAVKKLTTRTKLRDKAAPASIHAAPAAGDAASTAGTGTTASVGAPSGSGDASTTVSVKPSTPVVADSKPGSGSSTGSGSTAGSGSGSGSGSSSGSGGGSSTPPTPPTPPAPSGPTANIWMSSTGSDSGSACVRSATAVPAPTNAATACASINKAASLARAGDLVLVESGTYPAQVVNETNTDGYASRVVFRPETNDSSLVTLASLSVQGARNLEFQYMTIQAYAVTWNGSGGVTDVNARVADNIFVGHSKLGSQFGGVGIFGATNSIIDSSDITMGGCPVGQSLLLSGAANCSNASGSPVVQIKALMCASSGSPQCPAGTLVKDASGSGVTNSRIHDINKTNTADHQQCVFLGGPQNVVFTGNTLWNCGGNQGILFTNNGTGSNMPSGVFTRNSIGTVCDNYSTNACSGSQSISWNNGSGSVAIVNPLTIAFNSFAGVLVIGNGSTAQLLSGAGSLTVSNNIASKIATNTNGCPTFSGGSATLANNYVVTRTCASGAVLPVTLDQIWSNWSQATASGQPSAAAPDMSFTPAGTAALAGHSAGVSG